MATEISKILSTFFLQRKKEDVLGDVLKEKNESVIFVELSQLQKDLYQHILTLPEYEMLKTKDNPCKCGVNQSIFDFYIKIQHEPKRKQLAFMKANPCRLRKDCCGDLPIVGNKNGDDYELDQRAVIWKKQHPNDEQCERCPSCIGLPCMQKLSLVCAHVSKVQAPHDPANMVGYYSAEEVDKVQHLLNFAEQAFPEHLKEQLPQNSLIRSNGITDDHYKMSGKLKMLAKLCKKFKQRRDKCLIFSQHTETLDIIEVRVTKKRLTN